MGPELMNAARLGDVEATAQLAMLGPHVTNFRDADGWSALHGACYSDSAEIVRVLVKNGARIECKTVHGYTPLIEGSATGKANAVKALIGAGADVDAVDGDGWTSLHYAAAESRVEIVRLLLDAGARVDVSTGRGKLASDVACVAAVKDAIVRRMEEEQAARRQAVIANRTALDDREERLGHLVSRVSRAEGMLSESLRENEVLRDAVVHISAETERAGSWTSPESPAVVSQASLTQELRRLTAISCAAMSCLEEAGNHIRQMADSSLDEAFIQFSSIEMSDPLEVLWSSPHSQVVGARLLGRSVVVKRVNVNLEKAHGLHRTIFDDVAVFPALRHPNLITCLGVAFSPRPEVVFARVEGETLHNMLHGSSPADLSLLRTSYRIIRGICDGLAFLHLQAVVHGRFSSHHVLLGPDLEPRICGFAMSKTMQTVRSTNSGGSGGDWTRWASPEKAAAQMGEVGDLSKTDNYSFGMVCWELCSEVEPFGDVQDEDVLNKVRNGERPFTDNDYVVLIPELFQPLISACLSLDPMLRPAFVSCQNYLKTILPRLPVSSMRLDESCRRAFLRDLDLLRLALDRGDRFESPSGLHASELKARWQWLVSQRAEHVVQRALEFGVPVSCKIVGGLDYEKLARNGVLPSELFELDELVREPSFCPITFGLTNAVEPDRSDRILVEVYSDFGNEVGDEIVRVYQELYTRGGISRKVVCSAVDATSGEEMSPSQILSTLSKLMRSSTTDRDQEGGAGGPTLTSSPEPNASQTPLPPPLPDREKLTNSLQEVHAVDEEELQRQYMLDVEEEEHQLRHSQELENVDKLRSKAKAHMAMGEFGYAVVCLRSAIAMDPENASLHVRISAAYFAYGRYREALDHCNRAIDAQVELHSLNLRKTDCLLKLGMLTEAEALLKTCFCDEDGSAEAMNERMTSIQRVRTIGKLANFLLEKGQFEDVIKHVTEGLTHSPDNDDLLLLQGFALIGMNEGLLAIRAAESVLKRNSDCKGAWLVMGYAAFQCLGNLGFAVECFDRAEFGGSYPPPLYDVKVCNTIKIAHNARKTTEITNTSSSLLVLNSFTIAMQIRMIHNLAASAIDCMAQNNLNDAVVLLDKAVEYGAIKKTFGDAVTGARVLHLLKLFRSALARKEEAKNSK